MLPQHHQNQLNIGQVLPTTNAEGPGLRYALWVQGCSLRCPGCCNPHMFSAQKSNWMNISDIVEDIRKTKQQNPLLEGISILGGEPVEQPQGLLQLCSEVQKLDLSVMVFTGHLYTNLTQNPILYGFLSYCDILVDGPFEENQLEEEGQKRKWIGSQNQNIYILSDRYKHLEGDWPTDKNTVEIRMFNGEITINGFPFDDFMTIHKKVPSIEHTKHTSTFKLKK